MMMMNNVFENKMDLISDAGLELNNVQIMMNIENYINRRGGKMILFNTPSIRDIKHKNFFEQVMEKMCTDIVYKSYGKEVIDGEVFFESFKKPYFFDITRKNKSLYEKCFDNPNSTYIYDISHDNPDIIQNDAFFCFDDYKSNSINIENGIRNECNDNNKKNNIFVFGASNTFGYYVYDNETITSYLRTYDLGNYNIYNCATNGETIINLYNRIINFDIEKNDIVLIGVIPRMLNNNFNLFSSIDTNDYFEQTHDKENFVDGSHYTAYCHRNLSKIIYDKLKQFIFKIDSTKHFHINHNKGNSVIEAFYDEIGSKGITLKQTDAIGMTVGSCNPFTKGHRHLAEVGSKMFDYFIFFVMQDGYDLLFNKHDSEQLIKIGVQDLKNVIVVPFPNNMISYSEFCPSYNSVAIRHSKNFIGINVYELGNYLVMLCKACNINHYISGIEINDAVTRQMGLHFKYICELNDINFIAIPRIKNNDGKAISGTKCRELLRLKKFNELHDYMQNEVIKYIIDNNVEVKEFTKHKHLEDVLVQHDKNIYNHFGDKLDMISVQKDDYLSVIDDIKIIISSKNKYELNYDDESRNDLINIYHNNKIMSPWAAYFCYKLKIDTSKEIYDYIMNSKLDMAHKDDIKNES